MKLDGEREAQNRVDRITAFRAELADLEREQVLMLTPEQRAGLERHLSAVLSRLAQDYGADLTDSARRISWGMRIATLLGGTAFCAALVLFIGRIWEHLPGWVHAPLLASLPVGFLVAAEVTRGRSLSVYYRGLLAMAAVVAFIVELTFLGSTLNLESSPTSLLVWALFALLLAYSHALKPVLAIGLALLCVYAAAAATAALGYQWASFPDRAQFLLLAGGVVYAAPWIVRQDPLDFGLVFRLVGAAAGLIALLCLASLGDACCSRLTTGWKETVYQLCGLGLSVAFVAHGLALGRGGLVNLGSLGFVVFLFLRLHSWWWNWLPKYVFFLLLGVIAFLLLLVFRRMRLSLAGRVGA
jgi:uncharacterized membrane protein